MNSKRLLAAAITQPATLLKLDLQEWDALLPWLSQLGLLGRLCDAFDQAGSLTALPEPVRRQFERGRVIAQAHERVMRWEIHRLQRALEGLELPFILLKGAAYLAADFPWARSRLSSDIDILVEHARLADVENALTQAGWRGVQTSDYDDAYYRRWMHELPPMIHNLRGSVVDVHHAILPVTNRAQPGPALLWQQARLIDPNTRMYVLGDTDMLLHSVAHGFQHGELTHPFRDLADIHDLVTTLSVASVDFRERLVDRAFELQLGRPLWYALQYANRLLGTQVPPTALAGLAAAAPSLLTRVVMDSLMQQVFLSTDPATLRLRLARSALLARAHYLRMPLRLLVPHLARKLQQRLWPPDDKASAADHPDEA